MINSDITKTDKQSNKKRVDLREFLLSIVFALLVAIFIRSFIFEPFRIPSASMYPTLKIGDVLVVNRFSYGYSKHSLPWSIPVIPGRIFYTLPKQGDIVVIKLPEHPKRFFIKRLIGLPGDSIRLDRGNLYINNKLVSRKYLGNVNDERSGRGVNYAKYISVYNEVLPSGANYNTWSLESVTDQSTFPDTTDEYIIPQDQFFFMGDNRNDSSDSRDLDSFGFIHKDNLLGRASFILFCLKDFKRFFIKLH